MKKGAIVCLVIFVAGALLAILQLWFSLFDPEVFTKIIITLGILFVVALGVTLVRKEYLEHDKLKKGGYID